MSEIKLKALWAIQLEVLEELKKEIAEITSVSAIDQIQARIDSLEKGIEELDKTDSEVFDDKVFDYAGHEILAGDDDGDFDLVEETINE